MVKSVKGRRGTPASRTSRLNASSAKASTANSSAMPGSSRRNSELFSNATMPLDDDLGGDEGRRGSSTTRFDFDVSVAATPSLGRSTPAGSCLRRTSNGYVEGGGGGSDSSFDESSRPRSIVKLPAGAQGQLEEWRSRPHTLAHFGVAPGGPNFPHSSSASLHPIPPAVPEGEASSPEAATTSHGLSSRAASTVPVSRPSSPVGMDSSSSTRSRRKRSQLQGRRQHHHHAATRARTTSHGHASCSGGASRGEQSVAGSDGGATSLSSVGASSVDRHGISSGMSSESTRSRRDRTNSRARFASKDKVSVGFGFDDDDDSSGGGSVGGGLDSNRKKNSSSGGGLGVLVPTERAEGEHGPQPESPLSDDVSFYEEDRYSSSVTGSGDTGSTGVPSGGVIFSGAAFLLQREQAASYASSYSAPGSGPKKVTVVAGAASAKAPERPVTAVPGNKQGLHSSDSMSHSAVSPDLPVPSLPACRNGNGALNSAMAGSTKRQVSGAKPEKKCASFPASPIDEVIPPSSALPDRSSPIFAEGRGSKM